VTTQVLALNAYHGGSHRAFLEGWSGHSRHRFTILTLPPHKWKWRMRHAAITFADQVATRIRDGGQWQILFCTDMLNLAEFRGLCPPAVRQLPSIAYFHENQLTYPRRRDDPRDLHFAFTNMTTALVAERVWFNSAFHRDTFLTAVDDLARRMPDYPPLDIAAGTRAKAAVLHPGIDAPPTAADRRRDGPLRILWVGRWEHDKNPELFFDALERLRQRGREFRISVLGQAFEDVPACFAAARGRLADSIVHWGYLPDRRQYQQALCDADVVVSTADHEFFGIAVVEAVAAGCYPVLPNRLAYPELFGVQSECLYDGTLSGLVNRLEQLTRLHAAGELPALARRQAAAMTRFYWPAVAQRLDDAVDEIRE
jgi:glycosyltransferase involved in cell wall biosynthesis